MRRVLLFVLFLGLLGLSTAFAASFSVQSEDIATFSTDVSISVPTPEPTPFPNLIYVRGDLSGATGTLDLTAPVSNDSVTKKPLKLSTEAIGAQIDATKYFTWQSPTAPTAGYVLSGSVTLYIDQNAGGSNKMTAGLFSCPDAAPPSSITTGAEACTEIKVATGDPGAAGSGYQERTVSFGMVGPFVVPSGDQLRLKIVNRAQDGAIVLSTTDFGLQWGYLAARQSRLVISP